MFCADYVAAFVYHAFFTIGSVNLVGKEDVGKDGQSLLLLVSRALGLQSRDEKEGEKAASVLVPVAVGLTSGLCASVSLFPFDFVRAGVVSGPKRFLAAGSTVPYAGALFGVYFACRDPESTSSQLRWATAAASCAVLAEAPLDHAKRNMMGSARVVVAANLLFVPFAAMMLVMYDKAANKLVTPFIRPSLSLN